MDKADALSLKRLIEEQEKALIQTDKQLEQWSRFRSDYIALQERLRTLPNKTTHNVMVPFGPLAFMPGQLVHTNEILVLLGDNYFVERSAAQAADIITRRLTKLDENIKALQKQREMLTPRAQFTSEMLQMASGESEQQEIREEYDEEKERHWIERHKEYLRQAGEREMREKAEKDITADQKAEQPDTDFLDILDRLEQQENERHELEALEEREKELAAEQQSEHTQLDRMVEDEDSSLEESEERDEEHGEEDSSSAKEEEEILEHCRSKIITFTHTKQEDVTKQEDTSSGKDSAADKCVGDDADVVINSPADVFHFWKKQPKSILKKTESHGTVSHSQAVGRSSPEEPEKKVTFGTVQNEGERSLYGGVSVSFDETSRAGGILDESEMLPGKLRCNRQVQAFTNTVVERQTTTSDNQQLQDASHVSQPASAFSSRPMSEFGAARQKTDLVSEVSQKQFQMDSGAASQGSGDVSATRPVSRFRASRMKQGGGS